MDVYATKPLDKLMRIDLLSMISLREEWNAAKMLFTHSVKTAQILPVAIEVVAHSEEKLSEIIEDIQDVAMAYLSKEGRQIIDNRLKESGGSTILFDAAKTERFLQSVAVDALKLDSQDHVVEMINLMKSEIAERLAH